MIRVFDSKTNLTREVSEEEAQQGFLDGRFGLVGDRVNLIGADGQPFNIATEEASQAFEAGARIATEREVAAEKERARLSAPGQAALAHLEAAGRGLSLGALTPVEVALGVDPEQIKGRREANPEALATEIAASVATVPLTGGAGALGLGVRGAGLAARAGQAARVAGVLPRATAALGRATETGVRGALGARGATAAGRGLAAGAAGLAEGAVVGTGQVLSEAALGDIDLTAEQVLTGAARGAVFGGAASGLLTGTAVATGKAFKVAARKTLSAESMESLANRAAFRQFGPSQPQVRAAMRQFGDNPGEVIGRVVRDEGVDVFGKDADEILTIVQDRRQDWGQKVGDAIASLDETVDETMQPSLSRIGSRLRSEVVNPLKRSSSRTIRSIGFRVERELESYIAPVDKFGEPIKKISFRKLHRMRQDLDDVASTERGAAPTKFQVKLQKARRIVEGELLDASDRAAEVAGDAGALVKRALREDGVAVAEDATVTDLALLARNRADELERGLVNGVEGFDAALKKDQLPSVALIAKQLRSRVLSPLKRRASQEMREIGQSLDSVLGSFLHPVDNFGRPMERMGFGLLRQLRRELDDLASPPGVAGEQLAKAKRVIDDEIVKAADRTAEAAGEAGEAYSRLRDRVSLFRGTADSLELSSASGAELKAIGASYRRAKERFAVFSFLNDVAQKNVAQDVANRTISLTDTIVGAGGMPAGAVVGLLSGDVSVLGGLAVGALTGVAAGAVNKLIRAQGRKFAATAGSKLIAIRNTNKDVTNRIESAARSFVDKATTTATIGAAKISTTALDRQKEFDQRIASLEASLSGAQDMLGLEDETPRTAEAIQQTMTKAKTFVAAKAPRMPKLEGLRVEPSRVVSSPDQTKFLRYARAADNFDTVIQDFSEGRVTLEAIETANAVYPKSFKVLKTSLESALSKHDVSKMSAERRVQLSFVLGRPVHFSMDPAFIQTVQAMHTPIDEQGSPLAPSRRSAPDVAQTEITKTDQMEA